MQAPVHSNFDNLFTSITVPHDLGFRNIDRHGGESNDNVASYFINNRMFAIAVQAFTPNDVFCPDSAPTIYFYDLTCFHKFTTSFQTHQLVKYSQNKDS